MRAAPRLVHAWGFAVCTVTLGVTAHVLGGGLPPSGRVTLLLLAVVTLLARAAADREAGYGALLLGGAAVQAGIHVALLERGAGHARHSPVMLGCHVAALVLVAWWLRSGERALWRLASRVRLVLEAPDPVLVVAGPAAVPAAPAAPRGPRYVLGRHGRRGPPSAAR